MRGPLTPLAVYGHLDGQLDGHLSTASEDGTVRTQQPYLTTCCLNAVSSSAYTIVGDVRDKQRDGTGHDDE